MTTKKTTERQCQERTAAIHGGMRYTYKCDDGEEFSAIAVSESGAFRVLNAERPWMLATLVRTEPAT